MRTFWGENDIGGDAEERPVGAESLESCLLAVVKVLLQVLLGCQVTPTAAAVAAAHRTGLKGESGGEGTCHSCVPIHFLRSVFQSGHVTTGGEF